MAVGVTRIRHGYQHMPVHTGFINFRFLYMGLMRATP